MTTSDSEDFESADEDIEPEYSKSNSQNKAEKHENESDSKKCGNQSKDSHTTSSEALLKNTGQTVAEESSRESLSFPEVRNTEPVDKLDMKNECGAIDVSENNQDNSAMKTDDSQEVENLKSRKQHSRRPDRAGKSQRVRESKPGPMKLGVRLTNQKVTVESSNGPDEPEKKDGASISQPNEVSSDERTFHETEPYTSLLEKMSGMSTSAPASEAKEEEEHQASQSSGWGFGKGLMGSGGLGSLGGWGTSLLNTATLSVSTLGSHVTQGISTVLETVEAGIGAPNPEELARKIKEEKENAVDKENVNLHRKDTSKEREDADINEAELEMEAWGDWNDDDDGGGDSGVSGTGLLSLVSGVTQVTGKVFSTGLDTLEVIGKKTMQVLQEGDPGLKKKRALLLGESDQVVLSQVLREAKEKAEVEAKLMEEKEAARKAHFETLFDDYQGLVHLEALEMLSKQCDLRLKSMLLKESGPALRGLQIRLAAVQEMCEIPDPDETEEEPPILSDVLPEALGVLNIEVSADKLIQCIKDSYQNLEEMKSDVDESGVPKSVPRSIHQAAISSLATITAHAIEVFHKVTELLLVKDGKGREIKRETQGLVRVTTALTLEVNKIATEFSDFLSTKLNDSSLTADDKEKIESYITSIFLEASNSSTYIQDAFQLMVPVLQVGAIA